MSKKVFTGRPLIPGKIEGSAMVSKIGFNTYTSYKLNMVGGVTDKAICTD